MDVRDAERYASEFERVMREFMRHGRKYSTPKDGPPRSQFFLMSVLQHGGPKRIADLAEALGITSPAVTGLVNELVKSGHIRRTEASNDRRVTLIELTPKGHEVLKRVQQNHNQKAVEILQHFEPHEVDCFLKTLAKMHRLMQETWL